MTFYYRSASWGNNSDVTEKTANFWKHLAQKSNWRIVELPNGFFQTEYKDIDTDNWLDVTRRETIEAAERAIDKSIEHYSKKISFINGPKVVKTFEKE
jgi:nitrogen regulatory protein PII-like uncharacterized protein